MKNRLDIVQKFLTNPEKEAILNNKFLESFRELDGPLKFILKHFIEKDVQELQEITNFEKIKNWIPLISILVTIGASAIGLIAATR